MDSTHNDYRYKKGIKEYAGDDVTIIWKPKLCKDCGNCYKKLPAVFRINNKQWIHVHEGKTSEIMEIVKSCPTGALTFKLNDSYNLKIKS